MNPRTIIKTTVATVAVFAVAVGVSHYKPEWAFQTLMAIASVITVLSLYAFFKSVEKGGNVKAGIVLISGFCFLSAQTSPAFTPTATTGPDVQLKAPTGDMLVLSRYQINDPNQPGPTPQISVVAGCAVIVGLAALTYFGMKCLCKSAGLWPTNQPPPPPPPNVNTNMNGTNNPATNPPPKKVTSSLVVNPGQPGALVISNLVADTNSFPHYNVSSIPGDLSPYMFSPDGVYSNYYQFVTPIHIQASSNLTDWSTIESIYLWTSSPQYRDGISYIITCAALYDANGNLLQSVMTSNTMTYNPNGTISITESDGSENQLTEFSDELRVSLTTPNRYYRLSSTK